MGRNVCLTFECGNWGYCEIAADSFRRSILWKIPVWPGGFCRVDPRPMGCTRLIGNMSSVRSKLLAFFFFRAQLAVVSHQPRSDWNFNPQCLVGCWLPTRKVSKRAKSTQRSNWVRRVVGMGFTGLLFITSGRKGWGYQSWESSSTAPLPNYTDILASSIQYRYRPWPQRRSKEHLDKPRDNCFLAPKGPCTDTS